MPHVSYTQLKDLMRCPQRWYYGYWQDLRPRVRPGVVDVGDIGHKCLEAYYKGEDWEVVIEQGRIAAGEQASNEGLEYILDAYEEAAATVANIMPNYIKYAKENDPKVIAEILAVEKEGEFLLPSFKETTLGYKWDLLYRDHKGGIWLRENKFVKQMQGYEALEFDFQTHVYLWAAWMEGHQDVQGVEFNLIRHKPTKKEPDIWVVREKTYRTSVQLIRIGYEVVKAAHHRVTIRKALKRQDDSLIWRHMVWGCRDCWFRQVCIGEQKGIDMSVLKQEQFEVKEK
jgi:hypothetical protein